MADEMGSQYQDRDISTEMRESFLDYAMSIIVSRALPDVRDGLKPVHRRILYAMADIGMTPDKPFRKSAKVVGEVLAKYHPHSDTAVYETMVRMAQDFSLRYLLIDGHGNFGSIDGDGAAAMRYTECRLTKIALEMMRDMNKDTVDFIPNYDGEEKEPVVLPARIPNLLINGVSGIAVGMATNIPPHNLSEVVDALIALMHNPDITIDELMEYIKGPDFPTAGLLLGRHGIAQAYKTGRGTVVMRARAEIEEHNGKAKIIVSELPYQVNKARLIEKIAEHAREKRIEGITELRDETDRRGIRIVIELRRDVTPSVVLNNLFKQTQMQLNFSMNMLALVDNQPRLLNIKEMLYYYLQHQIEVIRRRTAFDLKKAEARLHILEGFRIALDYIDEVISIIRGSKTVDIARQALISRFNLSEEQAQAILDMRLRSLAGLERDKIEEEYADLLKKIAEFQALLGDNNLVEELIANDLRDIKERYGDERRTELAASEDDILDEDLIPREDVVITITHTGYIKRLPVSTYRSQRRGGKGIIGMDTKDEDFVEHLYVSNTHNHLLFFTDKGKVYRIKAYEIPDLSRTARGTPIINLLQVEPGESIQAVIPVESFEDGKYLFFATKHGIVKKTPLTDYAHIRKVGLIAIVLREEDELIDVKLTNGTNELIMGTSSGLSIRFPESDVRSTGRSSSGVKGIALHEGAHVIGMEVVEPGYDVLIVSANGYGKRTPIEEYRFQSRGGKGIKTMNVTAKNGHVVSLKVVKGDEDLMIMTSAGTMIRTAMEGIRVTGRIAMGVKLINISEGDTVATVSRIAKSEEDELDVAETDGTETQPDAPIRVADAPDFAGQDDEDEEDGLAYVAGIDPGDEEEEDLANQDPLDLNDDDLFIEEDPAEENGEFQADDEEDKPE
jgi:DNA gyrase subunit A